MVFKESITINFFFYICMCIYDCQKERFPGSGTGVNQEGSPAWLGPDLLRV